MREHRRSALLRKPLRHRYALCMDSDKTRLEQLAHRGIDALRRGDAAAARAAFEAIGETGRATPQIWLFLAQACDMQDDRPATHAALTKVLAGDPGNPYALVMQGEIFTRAGDDRAAVAWYERALRMTAGAQNLPPDLVLRLEAAAREKATAEARFLAEMQRSLADAGVDSGAAGPRFAEALAILAGQAQPMLQQPTSFYYPGLPQIAFYDPEDFSWVAALEAQTDAIRAEVRAVLADEDGVEPYVENPENRPSRAHALLGDPRWSAYHLWKDGKPVAAHAARCPATMAALHGLPIPVIADRSPMVLFSILRPQTHIPPHNGMLNTRLICHLPLVVPRGCRLRVGNDTRTVEAGKMLIFDDSIEHEAWNDNDELRAILLFEIWRPELRAAERAGLTAMFESVSGYAAG